MIGRIAEGSSGDIKYLIKNNDGLFLLRINDIDKLAKKQNEYNRLTVYENTDVNTPKPISFGVVKDKCYSVVSWLEGKSIMDIIKVDVTRDYYQLGINAGRELRRLHSVSVSEDSVNWYDVVTERAGKFLDCYHHLNIEFTGSKPAEKYILENLDCIRNRPLVMLHGDFHWNNCVADANNKIGIIDFSGSDIGDPWYDFGGVLWALEYSPSFVNGQLDGYFGTPPKEFWRVFKLYVALYAFEHLTFGNNTVEDTKCKINNASRMLGIYGEKYDSELPDFRLNQT